ncbi:Putative disease resistance protein RGA4 [Morus notabilis]|uniref:Putative disease resistance protein RGA4 n=1 Tax=Morus notabilis TaxID=981085 RepID=W9R2J5_9ROSA|nr:Putative disease resistance protein RGA4 [Morus notabilis]
MLGDANGTTTNKWRKAYSSALFEGILTNLAFEALEKIRLPFGVKDELRKLEATAATTEAALIDAEEKAKKVRIFFSSSNQLVLRVKMDNKIKQFREMLDDMKGNRVFLRLNARNEEIARLPSTLGGREIRCFLIDDSKKEKLYLLLDNNIETEKMMSIVPLVGMGGIGKTTLAQFLLNNELV